MILRVFPQRTSHTPTDRYAVVGDPPLWLPPDIDAVHVSVTFTWHVDEALRLLYGWQRDPRLEGVPFFLGGPAIGPPPGADAPPCPFVPGRYVRPGITYTSRGCNNACPWCLVPEREGPWRACPSIVPGHIVQDNNLLQGDRAHRQAVYAMLAEQRRVVRFQGGLEAARFTLWDEARIRGLRLGRNSLWFACDRPGAMGPLRSTLQRLRDLPLRFKRVYVLAGFFTDDSPEATDMRCRRIAGLGAIPFVQMYRGPGETTRRRWPDGWAPVVRRWSRPAASLAHMNRVRLGSAISVVSALKGSVPCPAPDS